MLHLITGRVGCGKTTYAHSLLKQFAAEGNDNMLLLVPEQFTYESDKGIIELLGAADACKLSVVSFERLAKRVFDVYGYPVKPVLDECGRAVFMSMSLEALSDKLRVYSRHAGKISFVSSLLTLKSELKQCAVTPGLLRSACASMPEGVLRQKGMELAMIYETYDALVAQSFFDGEDTLSRLADVLCKSDILDNRIIVLDGFRKLSAQELKIVERLMVKAKDVYVTLCCDGIGQSVSESGIFAGAKRTAQRLIQTANKNNVAVAAPVMLTDEKLGFSTYGSPALRHLERNLYQCDSVPFDGEAKEITVCCAGDIQEECSWVARTVKKLMREDFCRCRDIAVIFRSGDVYEREIKYALKKYGVPMFEDNRQPITNQPLINLVRTALELCSTGYATDSVMRYVKTTLAGLDADEYSELENYVLMWDISGKAWLSDWTFNPDGFGVEMNEERQVWLDSLNVLRRRVTEPLERLKADCDGKDGKQISALLYSYLIEIGADESLKKLAFALEESGDTALAVEQQQIWDMLMNQLDQTAVATDGYTLSLKKYAELFNLAVSSKALGRIPTGFDETFIGTAPRIQTRVPKVVFAVGMNDGVFPKGISSQGLFTDSERLVLEESRIELAENSRTQALEERFIVYNSLCSARERLYISYSCADIKGTRLSKSEVVEAVERLFPLHEHTETATADVFDNIDAAEPAFELLAANWSKNDSLSASLKSYFSSRDDFSGKIRALERAVDKSSFKIADSVLATKLFGKSMRLSASRIEVFESCPFQYFCKFGVGAKPRRTAKLDPAQSGLVIHYVLEKLLKEYGGKRLSSLDGEQLSKAVRGAVTAYAEEYMGGISDKEKRFTYLFERLAKTAEIIVSRLACEFEASSFEPCDFELQIGGDGPVKPYTVSLPNGGSMILYGFIDRVDKMERNGRQYIRIVDYKTGVKEFALSDVLNGLNMQMLLYMFALWQNGQEYYGSDIVPAGVLYLPARFQPYTSSRDEAPESVREKILSGGKMNGMLLNDENVLVGMDSNLTGMFVPVKRDRYGKITGTLIDEKQLQILKEKLDRILISIANSLQGGRIPAKPVLGRNHDKTCEFCDYQSVCCHEPDDEYRNIDSLTHTKCLELLSQEGG